MKRVAGYALTFVAGSLFAGTTAFAGVHMVKAAQGNAQIQVNGKSVVTASKLLVGKKTYLSVQSVEQAVAKAGLKATWKNNALNLVTPPMTKSSSESGQTQNKSSSTSGAATSTSQGNTSDGQTQIIGLSSLPYTVNYPDGMTIRINSINANSSATVFDITISNNGQSTDADPDFSMFSSSLADGGPAIAKVTDQDDDLSSPYNTAYNGLQPGESVEDVITYGPLLSGRTQFTWYLEDFDLNTQSLTFDLNK